MLHKACPFTAADEAFLQRLCQLLEFGRLAWSSIVGCSALSRCGCREGAHVHISVISYCRVLKLDVSPLVRRRSTCSSTKLRTFSSSSTRLSPTISTWTRYTHHVHLSRRLMIRASITGSKNTSLWQLPNLALALNPHFHCLRQHHKPPHQTAMARHRRAQ